MSYQWRWKKLLCFFAGRHEIAALSDDGVWRPVVMRDRCARCGTEMIRRIDERSHWEEMATEELVAEALMGTPGDPRGSHSASFYDHFQWFLERVPGDQVWVHEGNALRPGVIADREIHEPNATWARRRVTVDGADRLVHSYGMVSCPTDGG